MKIYWAGSSTGADDYIIQEHGNRLLTFAYPSDINRYLGKMEVLEKKVPQSLIVDSGAFSVWAKGEVLTVDDYLKFCLKMKPKFLEMFDTVHFVSLDVIPGVKNQTPDKHQRIDAAEQGLRNLDVMLKHLNPEEIIHVHHMYEDVKDIDRILERTNYMGVSPANDAHQVVKMKWMKDVFDYIPQGTQTHGFAVTAVDSIKEFPWTSVDSASGILSAAMGSIMTPWGTMSVSIKSKGSKIFTSKHTSVGLIKYIRDLGLDPNDVCTRHQARFEMNARFIRNLNIEINETATTDKYVKSQTSLF